jgi:hypothetical protein
MTKVISIKYPTKVQPIWEIEDIAIINRTFNNLNIEIEPQILLNTAKNNNKLPTNKEKIIRGATFCQVINKQQFSQSN